MRLPPRRSVSRDDAMDHDVISAASLEPEARASSSGITNPGYVSDDGEDDITSNFGSGDVVSDVRDPLPDDASRGRKYESSEADCYRISKTVFVASGLFVMGLYRSMTDHTLEGLRERVRSTHEEFNTGVVTRDVGYIAGCWMGGLLADIAPGNLELLLALGYYCGALGTGVLSWSPNHWLLVLMFLFQGLGSGIIITCSVVSCIRLWRERAALPIHSLHLAYSLGTLLGVLVSRPYRPPGGTTLSIRVPYGISSITTFIFCLTFARFHFYEMNFKKATATQGHWKCAFMKRICGLKEGQNWKEKVGFIILTLITFITLGGIERSGDHFLFRYGVGRDLNPLTPENVMTLSLLYWGLHVVGRGVVTLTSWRIGPGTLLLAAVTCTTSASSLLLLSSLWARGSVTSVWAGFSLLSLSLSPLLPATLSWVNTKVICTKVNLTGTAVARMLVAHAAGAVLFVSITELLIAQHGTQMLMFVLFCSSILLIIASTSLFLVSRKLRHSDNRILNRANSETQTDNIDADNEDDVKNKTGDVGCQAWPWDIR